MTTREEERRRKKDEEIKKKKKKAGTSTRLKMKKKKNGPVVGAHTSTITICSQVKKKPRLFCFKQLNRLFKKNE